MQVFSGFFRLWRSIFVHLGQLCRNQPGPFGSFLPSPAGWGGQNIHYIMNISVGRKQFASESVSRSGSELGPAELAELQALVLVQHPIDAFQRNGSPIPFLIAPARAKSIGPAPRVCLRGKPLVPARRGRPSRAAVEHQSNQNLAPPNSLSFRLLFLSSTQLMLHRAPKSSSLLPL